MSFRRIVSFATLVSFILLLVTSVVLYIVPHGRVAYWSEWRLLGLGKEQWGALAHHHGASLRGGGTRPYGAELAGNPDIHETQGFGRPACAQELVVALVLALFFAISTHFALPPVQWIMSLNEHLKVQSGERYGDPPYGHAEALLVALAGEADGVGRR